MGYVYSLRRPPLEHPPERTGRLCANCPHRPMGSLETRLHVADDLYCFQRIRGAVLNHQQKNARHLKHEVAAERISEQCMTSERPLFDGLDEQRKNLTPCHFELLCHPIDETEQTLDYSANRLCAYKENVMFLKDVDETLHAF